MTKLNSLFNIIKENKVDFYKRVKASTTGLAKLCLEGLVEGKRSKGRPKRRWVDDLKEWYNVKYMQELNKHIINNSNDI